MKKGQHRRKWSKEQKLEIVRKHLNEHISIKQLGRERKGRNRGWVVRTQNWDGRKKVKTEGVRKRKGSGASRGMDGPEKVARQGWVGGSICGDWIRRKTKGNCRRNYRRAVEEAARQKPPLDESGDIERTPRPYGRGFFVLKIWIHLTALLQSIK